MGQAQSSCGTVASSKISHDTFLRHPPGSVKYSAGCWEQNSRKLGTALLLESHQETWPERHLRAVWHSTSVSPTADSEVPGHTLSLGSGKCSFPGDILFVLLICKPHHGTKPFHSLGKRRFFHGGKHTMMWGCGDQHSPGTITGVPVNGLCPLSKTTVRSELEMPSISPCL